MSEQLHPTKSDWAELTEVLNRLGKEGIGIACPFCGEVGIRQMGSGMLEVECGTRIVIRPNPENGKHCVTFNGHALGPKHTAAERYLYQEFDCIPKKNLTSQISMRKY